MRSCRPLPSRTLPPSLNAEPFTSSRSIMLWSLLIRWRHFASRFARLGMPRLGEQVLKVRSKNAGPFWVTVDVFCGTSEAFQVMQRRLRTATVAALFQQPSQLLKRFDIADLNVIKFS